MRPIARGEPRTRVRKTACMRSEIPDRPASRPIMLLYQSVFFRAMHLTSKEERTLAGEEGPGRQKAMELLVAIGDIYGARRLIPITSAQVSGASFKTIGDAGIKFLEDFSKEAKATVRASVNPLGLDMKRWRSMGSTANCFSWARMFWAHANNR